MPVTSAKRRIGSRSGWALPLLGLTLIFAACAGPPQASDVLLEMSSNESAPLGGELTLKTDRPARVTLEIDDGEAIQTVTPVQELATEHRVLVLGLLPDTSHRVTPIVIDEGGRSTRLEAITVETPPLPDDFPPVEVPVRRPHLMEAGPTMINVFRWIPDQPGEDDKNWGLALAVDPEGRVRWYVRLDFSFEEVRRLRNGNLFFAGAHGRLTELDMLGNVVRTWHTRLAEPEHIKEGSILVDVDTFHHDVLEIENGNFLALSTEARLFSDYPVDYPPATGTQEAHVIGDVIAEFTKEGEVVRRVQVLDVLDPNRLGKGSLSTGFYEDEYEAVLEKPGHDWSHSNAIVYLPESDSVVVSSNMQSVHYKVDMGTGELEWLLGDPSGWREPWASKLLQPSGEVGWTYHQHGTEPTPDGTWLIFDNGAERAIPPDPEMPLEERYSRVVEYKIDEAAGTVEQVWEYGPEQEWFMSPFISDADHLPKTGNILITDGGRFVDSEGNQQRAFGGRNWARVLEVTHDEAREKLWELVIDDPSRGYSIYRAQRLQSLYPSLDRPTG